MNNFKELKETIIENYELKKLNLALKLGKLEKLELPSGSLAASIKKHLIEKESKVIKYTLTNGDNELEALFEAGKAVGQELAERKFTEADLVSFGEYLLSNERTKRFTDHYSEEDNISLEERLAGVYDADILNWCEKQTRK